MKTEYVALSPMGFAAAIVVGLLMGSTVNSTDLGHAMVTLAVAALLAFHVRNDAIQPIANGTYRRKLFIWRQDHNAQQTVAPAAGRGAGSDDARRALN